MAARTHTTTPREQRDALLDDAADLADRIRRRRRQLAGESDPIRRRMLELGLHELQGRQADLREVVDRFNDEVAWRFGLDPVRLL